jgi:glycosyltransferase involved in cell wall biosynthesis
MGRKELGLKDKRIIIVLYALELGGAEHQALLLGRHLFHEERARVQVVGFVNPGRAVELCEEYGLPWQLVPMELDLNSKTGILKAAFQFGWWLRRVHADVILPYLTPPNILCGLTWRWTGARVCIWNQRNGGIERVEPRLERWAARLTPWFVSNSSQGADFLERTLDVDPERIRIIRNGVEISKHATDVPAWRTALEVSESSFLACMVGNLHQGKDHVTLIKAWQQVVKQLTTMNLNAVLLLAGRFDSTDRSLKQLSEDLGVNEHVRFLGVVKDVAGLLRSVDVGILTSPFNNYEGCPNAVLEYMASGLAVIGTDIPGIRDVVDVSTHPFLVPIGDVDSLSERIIQLAVNPELRIRLGEANRQRAVTEFNLQNMCDKTVEFIKECIA